MKSQFLLLCFGISISLLAQEKIEIERKVNPQEFPSRAYEFVRKLFPNNKIHWLQEKNEDQISFEAKLKHDNRKYSLEFDQYGRFEDIEFIVDEEQLADSVLTKINNTLKKDFNNYEINKIQEQWVGSESQIAEALKTAKAQSSVEVNYEIVIYAKRETAYQKFEYLFDKNGVFIKKQKFSESNHDNFFY